MKGLGSHGNNENEMLKVCCLLDTANPRIVTLRSDKFFIDSNEEQRSCTRIIDSIRITEDSYTYMFGVQ